MSNRVLFVYSNIKVTLNPGDAPYYGFEILAGEAQCEARGTLFDLGVDAGFIPEGNGKVRGQIWTTLNIYLIEELKEFAYPKGNVRLHPVDVTISDDKDKLVVPATVFAMEHIPRDARIIDSGFWPVRATR